MSPSVPMESIFGCVASTDITLLLAVNPVPAYKSAKASTVVNWWASSSSAKVAKKAPCTGVTGSYSVKSTLNDTAPTSPQMYFYLLNH